MASSQGKKPLPTQAAKRLVFALESFSAAGNSGRKTTRLRSRELRRGRQFTGSRGPPFAEATARQATQAGERQVMPQADKAMLVWWRRTSFTIFSISVMIGGIGFGLYL